MINRWSDTEAEATVTRYAATDITEDLALRVYTTRLLGVDPELVLHGGGNTSVKTSATDLAGSQIDVLHVKGSGWDMGTIEPAGLPAVRIDMLLPMARIGDLSDEDMVNVVRGSLLDSRSPNPSVETLLHAFVPHKFIDHTHADAVVALTDQADGEARVRDLFGDRLAIVPYVMPGFQLSLAANEIFLADTGVEGLVLLNHGIFTFGATAREAYDRMIAFVDMAEKAIEACSPVSFPASALLPERAPSVSDVAPVLRGLLGSDSDGDSGEHATWLLDSRTGTDVLDYVNGEELQRYSQQGTVTPDHVIRTKPLPWIAPAPSADDLPAFAEAARTSLGRFEEEYRAYFARNDARLGGDRTELDRVPRVVLVPGVGIFGVGRSVREAAVAADLAEVNVRVIAAAERIGRYQCIPEEDLFEVEYWSLEQAKLGRAAAKPLAGKVCVVTGGAGTIGEATAKEFAAAGAYVAVLDLNEPAAQTVAEEVGGLGVECDVTDAPSVRAAFDAVCAGPGGIDIVVSNAGAAWQGPIGDLADETLRRSFELNFFAHQTVAQHALRVMRAQGTGGCLLFNASKQALNPGKGFGAYGLAKAATLFLMKQYALDHGGEGIRSNAVNADRIRSGLLSDEMIDARAAARGITEADYLGGNLLGREVKAEDVAAAFLHLAMAPKTTAAILTVDGGNIEASVR